jgi:hypothetical protein
VRVLQPANREFLFCFVRAPEAAASPTSPHSDRTSASCHARGGAALSREVCVASRHFRPTLLRTSNADLPDFVAVPVDSPHTPKDHSARSCDSGCCSTINKQTIGRPCLSFIWLTSRDTTNQMTEGNAPNQEGLGRLTGIWSKMQIQTPPPRSGANDITKFLSKGLRDKRRSGTGSNLSPVKGHLPKVQLEVRKLIGWVSSVP